MSGDYVLRVVAMARQAGNERPRLDVQVDGTSRQVFQVPGEGIIASSFERKSYARGLLGA